MVVKSTTRLFLSFSHQLNARRVTSAWSQCRFLSFQRQKTPFDVLGVSQHDSKEVIKKKYYKLCQKYHPDVNSSPEAKVLMAEINSAYESIQNGSAMQMNQQPDMNPSSPYTGFGAQYGYYGRSHATNETPDEYFRRMEFVHRMQDRIRREQHEAFYGYTPSASEGDNISSSKFRRWLVNNIPIFKPRTRRRSVDMNEAYFGERSSASHQDRNFGRMMLKLTWRRRFVVILVYMLICYMMFQMSLTLFASSLKRHYERQRLKHVEEKEKERKMYQDRSDNIRVVPVIKDGQETVITVRDPGERMARRTRS